LEAGQSNSFAPNIELLVRPRADLALRWPVPYGPTLPTDRSIQDATKPKRRTERIGPPRWVARL